MKETKNSTWKQKLNSNSSLKNDINSIFRFAKKDKTAFKDILNSIKLRVYDNQKYTTLPNYMKAGINGYIEANFQIMYEHVTWSHWYNGSFVGNKLEFNKDFKQELVISNYVYNNTQVIYS